MAGPRTNKLSSHQLEAEEQKTTLRQRWINRVHKDLNMIRILNGEELVKDRKQMERSGVAAKDLNGLY